MVDLATVGQVVEFLAGLVIWLLVLLPVLHQLPLLASHGPPESEAEQAGPPTEDSP